MHSQYQYFIHRFHESPLSIRQVQSPAGTGSQRSPGMPLAHEQLTAWGQGDLQTSLHARGRRAPTGAGTGLRGGWRQTGALSPGQPGGFMEEDRGYQWGGRVYIQQKVGQYRGREGQTPRHLETETPVGRGWDGDPGMQRPCLAQSRQVLSPKTASGT